MEDLTDIQLRDELKKLGFTPGPVTDSTRSVYLKKLTKLRSEAKPTRESGVTKGRITRGVRTSPSRQNSERLNERQEIDSEIHTTRQSVRPIITPVASSSGDSITSLENDRASRTNISSTSNGPSVPPTPGSSTYRLSLGRLPAPSFSSTSSHGDKTKVGTFRTPQPPNDTRHISRDVTPQRAAGHTPTRKTYVYYKGGLSSDSETEEDSEQRRSPFANTMSRVTGWLRGGSERKNSSSTYTPGRPTKSRLSWDPRDEGHIQISDTDYSDGEMMQSKLFTRRSRGSVGGPQDKGIGTSLSLLFTPPRSTEKVSTRVQKPGLSIMSDDQDTEFRTKSSEAYHRQYPHTDTTSHANRLISYLVTYVPNLILICGVVAIFALAMSYLILRDHHGEVGKMADLQKIVCGSSVSPDTMNPVETHGCLHQKDLDEALPALGIAYDILSRYAGEYHCGTTKLASPRMSTVAAMGLVEREWKHTQKQPDQTHSFGEIWRNVLFLIIHVGKVHFKIVSYDSLGNELDSNNKVNEILELESIQPYFSGLCRMQLWASWLARMCVTLLWTILTCVLVIGVLLLLRWIRQRRLRMLEQRTSRIRDLVAEVVHLLQQQLRENEVNPDQPPYLPVFVLRDKLRQKHQDVIQLWPEVVHYVYEVETCIGVREWRGIGETWQWQGGTGWQGSALIDKSQKPPFLVPPTECLKIRNMFSIESLDERGKRRIKRELLKKLITCGPILHIGLDSVGTDGLVYVKCADAETAGQVYHAVHANYFDGRLLTVKFLRDNKYCLRFPEAHGLHVPMSVADLE